MASRIFNLLKQDRVKHAVGNLNSLRVRTIAHGAKATVDMENYTFVELAFDAEGERTCTPLTADAKKAYLVAASEEMYEVAGVKDSFADYYVGKDEKVRVVILEQGLRFETSNHSITAPTKGMEAYYDVATKKIKNGTAPTGAVKLTVVEVEKASVLDGLKCVRFEVA